MKSLFFLVSFFLMLNATAQTKQDIQEVRQLYSGNFKLNNGFRSSVMNGISRDYIHIELPENTINWFYFFSTSLNNENSQTFNQISKAILHLASKSAAAYTGGTTLAMANAIIAKINMPTGQSSINLYVMDKSNADLFFAKKYFEYYEGIEKQTEWKAVSDQLYSNDFYLGIQNTSTFERAVYTDLQVYATVLKKNESVNYNSSNSTDQNTDTDSYNAIAKSWLDHNIGELIKSWGQPTRTNVLSNGNKIYIWSKPGIDCVTKFTVNENNIIIYYRWNGSECK